MQETTALKIKIIIGSTRKNRFSEKPANWIYEQTKKLQGIDAELIDLRDWPLPFFEEVTSPSMAKGEYTNDLQKKWAEKISEADGYIIVTPEYNHGYPAVLKNALDYAYTEWNNKPVAFVSYGGVGGARAIEQLRQVAIELQMAPIRNSVHIPWALYMAVSAEQFPVKEEVFEPVNSAKDGLLNQLVWWATALKTARNTKV